MKNLIIASSEEEIDDEEPELVIEEEEEDNLDRLEASGISVTVIEKKKMQEKAGVEAASVVTRKPSTTTVNQPTSVEAATKNNKDIGLSSDISVTVVHKKKVEVGPKISVKKESELLIDPAAKKDNKDLVEVTTRAKQPPQQQPQQHRRTSVDVERGKTPPDPIVTISKVQNAVQPPGMTFF